MSKTKTASDGPKGFTFAEKAIIWIVFCLLVGLSTNILIFPAMLLLSWSIMKWRGQYLSKAPLLNRLYPILTFLAGAGLIWWVIQGQR
ncbi:hypothetical protein KJ068_27760 [bacterium]|nr:MAG: hypothetical protein EDS67_29670 [candidate division KSB1 bacterium]MCE7945653.1 hypothetical protein [Chlorobi bacterium CHB1]MCL4708974.1 hypothetical protein [bacterium]MDL1879185.1 hypothetical protein [Cytophagia bacterium CHB2]MBC6952058.1 hypothetical protein [candidate division KSB1 bacterium]